MKHFKLIIFHLVIAGGILFFSNSCTFHRLTVQTQYLNHDYLASYHVGTPDPHLYDPVMGQRLFIQWSLCAQEIKNQPLFLYLKVRFRNRQEQEIKIPILSKRGTYIYNLPHDAYCQSRGILTYYALIRSEFSLLASWKHPLWVELITFDFPDLEETKKQESSNKRVFESIRN